MGRGKRHRTRHGQGRLRALPRRSTRPDLVLWPEEELPGLDDPEAQAAVTRLRALGPDELGRRLGGGLIVDLDDTLNVNMPLFLRSRGLLVEIFSELAPERDVYELAEEHREISNALVPRYGYTPRRWREGALAAAGRFAERELTADERQRVLDAAEAGVGIGELYDGVAETLSLLQEAGVKLLLLTKGEEEKQREKVRGHQLERFFDQVVIVPAKDADLLERLADEHDLRDAVVVGDSERSDIAPAKEAGLAVVLVDRGAPKWQLERLEQALAGETPQATSFAAAVALLAG